MTTLLTAATRSPTGRAVAACLLRCAVVMVTRTTGSSHDVASSASATCTGRREGTRIGK